MPLDISVLVPAFDEGPGVSALAAQLGEALRGSNSEIILVDDGSSDDTAARAHREPNLRCVSIPRSGKSAALRHGFALSQAPIIITIDADLQEDPNRIGEMVELCQEGADCVTAVRSPRLDPVLTKTGPARIYSLLILALFSRSFADIGCGFRACRRSALSGIPWFDGAHRLVPLLIARQGGGVRELPVTHRRRSSGQGKFGSPRRFGPALADLVRVRMGLYDSEGKRLGDPERAA